MSKSTKHNNNEYLAFISYQRKDETIAKKLQNTLEFYNLPIAIVEKEPDLKDGIRPIFVDMTELGDEPFLKPAIEKALRESRFLIVICSTKSAKSKWVNKEVQYFLQLKRTKRIIPFIIEGIPNAKLKDEECCTPLLKKLLGQRELLGININEMGFDAAAVKVVSRMFHIGFRTLWNRYEKEKEEEQRKLKEQNDRLLIAQSRFIAEKANQLVDEGDSYLARKILLEVLDSQRPLTVEAECAFRRASLHQSAVLRGNMSWVKTAFFSPDGKLIVSTDDQTIRIWDVETGQQIGRPLKGHMGRVNNANFSPDGRRIVSASKDKTVCVFDAETGRPMRWLKGHTEQVNFATFSPDCKCIVSASDDNTVRIWNAETGTLKGHPLIGHTGPVNSASFSPDGKYIVSASDDNTIRIWDAETMLQIGHPLIGHTRQVNFATFSPNSKYIVSASHDNTVRIWHAKTGMQMGKSLEGHTFWVNTASFSPDGKSIVSASWDKTMRIWGFPPLEKLIEDTRERFRGYPLTDEEKKKYYLE